jgi:hypothetical protein
LFTKEFSVSTAPEVGRIIDFQNLPSTLNFHFLSINLKNANSFYIDGTTSIVEQYIAQYFAVKHHSSIYLSSMTSDEHPQ